MTHSLFLILPYYDKTHLGKRCLPVIFSSGALSIHGQQVLIYSSSDYDKNFVQHFGDFSEFFSIL